MAKSLKACVLRLLPYIYFLHELRNLFVRYSRSEVKFSKPNNNPEPTQSPNLLQCDLPKARSKPLITKL